MLSVLIVDDEKLARERIRFLLKDQADITICAESSDGLTAINDIQNHNPDLVYLDVQMPEKNGFEVLQAIEQDKMPTIIFVTAYDKYAIDAFEVCAIDYLLKPFDDERFFRALERARDNNRKDTTPEALEELISRSLSTNNYNERISIKKDGRIYFVDSKDIVLIKASAKQVEIQTSSETHLLRKSITVIEEELDPKEFIRIHRSTIVNISKIQEMQHWHKSEYMFLMSNGEKVISSHSYREKVQRLI